MYPPKLYSGPTIQSRSAARRAAQDLVIIIIIIIIIIIGQTSLPNESPPTWINDIFQVLISFCGDNALRISK